MVYGILILLVIVSLVLGFIIDINEVYYEN